MKNNYILYSLFSLAFLTIWSACRKAEGPVMNYAIAAPDSIHLSAKGQTVTASWLYPSSGQPLTHFIVELAADEDFDNVIASDTLLPDARDISFDNTGYKNAYYFRILAQAENVAQNTAYISKSLLFNNLFLPIGQFDATANSVVLKWNTPVSGSVTSILLIPDGGSPMAPIELSASNIENSTITIDNLDALTDYTALLFDGETREGVIQFTTKDPNAKITINSDTKTYRTLADAIKDAASGDVINIGGSYDFSGLGNIEIDKSLTIQGIDGVEKPQITLGKIILQENVKSFKLYRLQLISSSPSRAIDVSAVKGTLNVNIDSCNISGATKGLIYASSDATGTYGLTINNSLMHDFGGGEDYNFIDFRAGDISAMSITNSTFWNMAYSFFKFDEDVTYSGVNPAKLENCTLDNICSWAFVSIHTQAVELHVDHCILTNMNSSRGNDYGVSCYGYANKNNTHGENSDIFLQYFDYWTKETTITNITHLDPKYKDVTNGDFTVGNSQLKALGIGDPRWLN